MTDFKRSPRVLLAAVVLLLAAGLALAAFLPSRGGDGQPSSTPVLSGPSPAAEPDATAGKPAVPEAQLLTAAPENVTWELFEGVALPTSPVDGPTRVDGPVHAGFSRTPTGALLADAQISTRSLVDRDVAALLAVARAQLVDGPGKTAFVNLLGQLEGRNDPPASGYAQIAGFRYITFTPELAVISRATRDQGGRIQASTDTLRWVDGDWKLEKPTTGLQQAQVIQDLSGYVPWSGIS